MSNERSALASLASKVRIGQFVSVGVVGATAESVVLAVLTAGFGVVPLLAKAVGAEVSITLMFLLNERWTFSESGASGLLPFVRRLGKSHLVRLGGLAVAFGVLYVLTELTTVRLLVAGADLWPTVANGIGIVCGMVLNYLTESLFTWRVHR
jgi:putative flippase GtrA